MRKVAAILAALVLSASLADASSPPAARCEGTAPSEFHCGRSFIAARTVQGWEAHTAFEGLLVARITDTSGNVVIQTCDSELVHSGCRGSGWPAGGLPAGGTVTLDVAVVGVGDWSFSLLY